TIVCPRRLFSESFNGIGRGGGASPLADDASLGRHAAEKVVRPPDLDAGHDHRFFHGRAVFVLQAEDGIRDWSVTGVQTCALPICWRIAPTMRPPVATSAGPS